MCSGFSDLRAIDGLFGIVDLARVNVGQMVVGRICDVVKVANEPFVFGFRKGKSSELFEFVSEDSFKVGLSVAGVASRIHHESGIKGLGTGGDFDLGGDTIGVFLVEFRTAMLERNFLHEGASVGVVEGFLAVVGREKDEFLPEIVKIVDVFEEVRGGNRLVEQSRDDIDHRVVS